MSLLIRPNPQSLTSVFIRSKDATAKVPTLRRYLRPGQYSLRNRRSFCSSPPLNENEFAKKASNDGSYDGSKSSKKKTRTQNHGKISLRRIAVEAERSRATVKIHQGRKTPVEHDSGSKVVTAFCAAEQYNVATVAQNLRDSGYPLDPSRHGLYSQVVHVRVPESHSTTDKGKVDAGDVFIFPSGTVVAWNVEEDVVERMITKELRTAAENPHPASIETENLEYIEDLASFKSHVEGDTIKLGIKVDVKSITEDLVSQDSSDTAVKDQPSEAQILRQHETNLVLAKIAFSSGLARSVKLAVLETTLESYFQSTRSIPTLLSKGSKPPFTRSFILRKTGELLNARAQLNLNSELMDSIPDMFWDSRHELGLENYFDQVGRALDVNIRSRILNQKMDYAQEIVTALGSQLSERHGFTLEWLVIILISIEVGFEILRLWRERLAREDPDSLESLKRRYLEKVLGNET